MPQESVVDERHKIILMRHPPGVSSRRDLPAGYLVDVYIYVQFRSGLLAFFSSPSPLPSNTKVPVWVGHRKSKEQPIRRTLRGFNRRSRGTIRRSERQHGARISAPKPTHLSTAATNLG